MRQTYIEWLYPGMIFSDTSTEKVNNRDIPKKFKKHSFGFRFYEREEITTTEGEELQGKPQNYSGWYYIGGEKLTLEYVKKNHPTKDILISNMEINNWNEVVFTKQGQAFPLEKNDVVL